MCFVLIIMMSFASYKALTIHINPNPSTGHIRSCVDVEVVVLGSPSLINLMVSLDVKQH